MADPLAPFRLALIGCGRIAQLHARRIVDDGRAVLAAACDDQPRAAQALVDEFAPGSPAFGDLDELLAAVPLDAAIVATPTHLHYEHVLACRERGVHVLCEKPLADTRERIVALVDAARSGGPHLSVAYQRRYWSLYRTLRREVLSGRWGRVRAVTSSNLENWQQTIAGTWRDDPVRNPGGFIGDAGSHKIDSVFFVTGLAAKDAFARTDCCGSRVEIVAQVIAKLTGSVPLSMSFIGNAQNFGEELAIHCETADLVIRDNRLTIARTADVREPENPDPETNPVSAFLDLLSGRSSNPAPAECALPVFDFTRAILESARHGMPVSVKSGG